MEGIISSIDSFQLLRVLMVEFPTEGFVRMALFFSALAFCFWGWWRKYAQTLFLLCFSFKFSTSSHQIRVSRVPAMVFAVDRVSHEKKAAKENRESAKRGRIYMRFERSIQSPEDEFFRKSEESEHFRDYGDLQELVKCFDVSWRRQILAGRTEDSNNTVRLWDIPTSKSVNCMKFHETSVIAGARVWNSPDPNLLSGIGIEKQKSTLYVWDSRSFPKPLSFCLGKNSGSDIVEFKDKKVYVCDELSERVFDLRMTGAGVVEINGRGERRIREREPSLQDFGVCTSSLLQ